MDEGRSLMARTPIDPQTARQIKRMLWKGTAQDRISLVTGASQSTISRIRAGKAHESVPWPDGSLGAIPEGQSPEVAWSTDAARLMAFPDMMQKRIFAVVNEARRNSEQPEIPPADTSYLEVLDAEGADAQWEAMAIIRAREAEDKRLSTLMTEFDELVAEQRALLHEESARVIITSTRQEPDLVEVRSPQPALTKSDQLDWDYVRELAPSNPLVIEAFETDDPLLIQALCVVFKALERFPHNWGEPFALRAVRDLASQLRSDNE